MNAGFGAATALGLFLLAVPNPALWGMLAGAFREEQSCYRGAVPSSLPG